MELQNVVIVDGVRSAFARGGRGAFTATRLDTIGVQVLQELLSRYPQVAPEDIEDVGMGCVGGVAELAGIGANHIVRLAGLPESVCTFDSNRQCGSSMETLHRVTQEIMVGAIDVGVALGVERMGRQLGGGGGAAQTRITEFNSSRHEQSESPAQPRARPRPQLLGPDPRRHPRLLARLLDAADRAERRRDVRPQP